MTLATYVDNLVAPGASPEAATAVLDDCETFLMQHWGLQFGDDSREFIVCHGYPDAVTVDDRWKRCMAIRCLGHFLDADGGIQTCLDNAIRNMWRSFFGNLSARLLSTPAAVKMRFLNQSVASIASFRWSRWPFQHCKAARLDGVQRKMVGILLGSRPTSGESFDSYVRRRHRTTSRLATKHGLWSKMWASSVISWGSHVDRGHDRGAWSRPLLQWHDLDWLERQRRAASSGPFESRTRTRAYRGGVHRRWSEGHVAASMY